MKTESVTVIFYSFWKSHMQHANAQKRVQIEAYRDILKMNRSVKFIGCVVNIRYYTHFNPLISIGL